MNNFHDNLPFGLSYADLSQAPSLDSVVVHSSQLHNQPLQEAHLHDPAPYQNLPTYNHPFPILPAGIPPPQLHQPTLNKETHPAHSKPKQRNRDRPAEGAEPPVRVTRPPNAFLLFNRELRKRLKDSNPTMKVAEISKEISKRWRSLSETDKKRYVDEANALKESQRALHPNSMYVRRSKAELAKAGHYARLKRKAMHATEEDGTADQQLLEGVFEAPKGEGSVNSSGGSSTSSPKPPPRKRQHRRDRNPNAPKHPLSAYMWYLTEVRPETMQTYPGSTVGQISKLCADRWNTMTDTERMPWHIKAQADKSRYAREMQVYAAQQDHPLGRGTRQKYRSISAAAAAAASAGLIMSNNHGVMFPHSTSTPTPTAAANASVAHLPPDYQTATTTAIKQPLSVPSSPSSLLDASTVQDTMSPESLLPFNEQYRG